MNQFQVQQYITLLQQQMEFAFEIESSSDVQVTLEVEAGQEYKVFIDNTNVGMMKANLGGKLTLSVELSEGTAAAVRVKKQ